MNQIINSCLTALNSIGRGFCDYTAGMFVQSSVLIVLLLIVDFLLRKRVRAVFRYCVWMLVFVKLILPPTLCLPTGIGYWCGDYLSAGSPVLQQVSDVVQPEPDKAVAPVQSRDREGAVTAYLAPGFTGGSNEEHLAPDSIGATNETDFTWPTPAVPSLAPITWQAVVFLLWLVGVLIISVLLIQRMSFVKGLIAQSALVKNRLPDMLNQCRQRVGIRRNIELRLSNNISAPAVCGLFKPVILIPIALLEKLSPDKLRTVLIHELVHIKRADIWVNLVQTILQIIYFYNPFVWLANAVVRRVREQAVDEMVLVTLGAGAKSYSNTLIDIAEMAFWKTSLSLRLIGVVESKKALHKRIRYMLNRPIPKKAKLGIVGLIAVIIIAAVLLPMAASKPGPPELVIKGMVKDAQTGEPIAGARVFDDGYGPKPNWEQIKADVRSEWGAITNSAGEYSFLTWPEHHSITVETPGYKAERRSLYSGHFVFNKKDEEIFDFALESEKASDSSEFTGQRGPLDIRLAGVRPDGSDDIYDGNGNKIAVNTFANVATRWSKDSQHRTFIFELPKTEEPILFPPFLGIKPTGAKHGLGTFQYPLLYYSGDKLTYSVAMNFPRTYKKIFERRIRRVDLTLRYYYGRRGAADFVFTSPFTAAQTVKADRGADCELTAKEDRLNYVNKPAAFFMISSKTRFDSDSVLIYDTFGRRYLPESEGGRSGTDGSEYRFRAEGLTLNSIAYVTVGEKPYEATFKNVVVSYPDRPVRDRMEFLDEMCERLDLTGLSGEDLYKYKFENPADAIKVINIVRGQRYVMQVFNAIRWAQPKVELSSLDEQTQEEIRSAAAKWAKAGHPNIRAMGIRLGLMGGWPEFMDLALEWLEQDVIVYDMVSRAYRGLEEGAKGEIAGEIARYPAGLKSEQAERIKRIILRTDNPHLRVRLFTLFWRADKDLTFQTCRDLVQDDRPWIWWPAMCSLFNRCTEKLRPFGNLPEKMQKRLILVNEASGSSRLFDVSSSGRDYDIVAKEAYAMLPGMFTARLARMNGVACRGVRTVMVKHLDRELATRAMTDFLREISAEPTQWLWAGDSYYFNTCCIMAYHIALHINSLYDVDINNLGKYETRENSGDLPYNISRLKQLIAATLQWYDNRSGADNESGRATEVGAGNKAGQSPFSATLPNGVTVELVGVCDIPADGKQWWAADGSPLENVFWDGTTNREDAEDARQMVFRVRSNDSDPDLAPTASFQVHRQQQPPGSWSGAFVVSKDNQTLDELRGVCFSLHDDQRVADVSAVISSGPWKTQSTLNVSSANDVMVIFTNVGKMVWSEPVDKGGKTNISVTLTKMPEVIQIVATDKQGNKIHSESMFGSSWDADGNAGGMAVAKAIFWVPLSRIDRFHFQTRKAEHITFKNVSLKPNFKTNVQTDVEPRRAEQRGNIVNRSRHRLFVKLVVGKDKMTFEGQEVTWDKLPSLLQKVPNRSQTVLCVAVASDQMTLSQVNQVKSRAGSLSRQFGFEYLSYIGIHPLGSKGGLSHAIFEGQLQFNEEIRIPLEVGTAEKPGLVKCQWIKFDKSDNKLGVSLHLKLSSRHNATWEIRVRLLDAKGRQVSSSYFIENSGIIQGVPVLSEEELQFTLGRWSDLSEAVRFEVRIRQLLDAIAGTITVRYTGKADVQVEAVDEQGNLAERRKLYLPDLETPDAKVVLDLATGEMFSAAGMEKDRHYFEKLGKGDLVYEYASGQSGLLCLRGARMQMRTADGLSSLKPDVQRSNFVVYFIKKVPCKYQITTAEGSKYELKFLSVDKGDKSGAHVEYWKSDK